MIGKGYQIPKMMSWSAKCIRIIHQAIRLAEDGLTVMVVEFWEHPAELQASRFRVFAPIVE
jgi:hypothetical protein